MKLERLPEFVTSATAILVGLFFAYFCGRLTGDGDANLAVALVAGLAILALCIGLRANIWLFMVACWPLTGTLPPLDLPLSVRDLGVLVVFCAYLIFYALKLIRTKPKFDFLDLIVLANLVYLATVFLRNPVGVKWLGSEMVGGRPYFNIAIAYIASWVLLRAPVDLKTVRRLPIFLLIGSAFVSVGSLFKEIVPSSTGVLGKFYSDFAPPEINSAAEVEDLIGRKPAFSTVGSAGMLLLCSYFRPLTLLSPLNIGRFLGAVIFTLAILLSGFRSALFTEGAYAMLSSYLRRQKRDIIIFGLMGMVTLTILAIGNNRLFTLPIAAQRAFSFLPGNWDYAAEQDAKASTEWRVEMWKMVLTEGKWIRNRVLGDGFGFSRYELEIMMSRAGYVGGAQQEAFLINGVYHSGPLSAIRYVGVVGLLLYYWLMLLLAWRAMQLIRSCQGTTLFSVALFVGMPLLFAPFAFTLIVGAFDLDFPQSLFMAGVLKLVERARRSIPDPTLFASEKVTKKILVPSGMGGPSRRAPAALPTHI